MQYRLDDQRYPTKYLQMRREKVDSEKNKTISDGEVFFGRAFL